MVPSDEHRGDIPLLQLLCQIEDLKESDGTARGPGWAGWEHAWLGGCLWTFGAGLPALVLGSPVTGISPGTRKPSSRVC